MPDENLTVVSGQSAPVGEIAKKRGKSEVGRKGGTLRAAKKRRGSGDSQLARFPRNTLDKALRIPKSILDQNAGKECSEKEAASFLGVAHGGTFQLEVSSAIKYGLLERPGSGRIRVSDLAKSILRPQSPEDETIGLRKAVLNAPEISDVYSHYRGENLPDRQFFDNALVDTFHIPRGKVTEFYEIFIPTLEKAGLLEKAGEKFRIIDSAPASGGSEGSDAQLKKIGKGIKVSPTDVCFVITPFVQPYGSYYQLIYEPAIRRAGLQPVRADNEIFGTGKIMDQIWSGIHSAKVLLADLTTRNPNVFYELGLAHALKKPVVLISSNQNDVPFDLKHIRVIYYDLTDPFWGDKLMGKIAENVLSAIKNPQEALFPGAAGPDTNQTLRDDAK